MSGGYVFDYRDAWIRNSELDLAVRLWVEDKSAAIEKYGEINTWDVSKITDFTHLFSSDNKDNEFSDYFNSDISNWDVSNGVKFNRMFYGNDNFNQDISKWDVSKGEQFSGMFRGALKFNQDISVWDVSSGIYFNEMFYWAFEFNQDLTGWNVINGLQFNNMFSTFSDPDGDGRNYIQFSRTPLKTEFIGEAFYIKKVAENNSSYIQDSNGFSSISSSAPIKVTAYEIGEETTLDLIRDYDGYKHAKDSLEATPSSYKYQGMLDVNGDGVFETIFTNKSSKRWVTAEVNSSTGEINFNDYGRGGSTRVVGIYIDPLVESGEVIKDSDFDSQRRFQNDLEIDNLSTKHSGDYDGDGIHEVYWETNDGTAYLRSLMHADGNIRYANYQSKDQMSEYLTTQGHTEIISDIL